MPGPMPKDPITRQRRNKGSTRATLHAADEGWKRAPSLPARGEGLEWHGLTRAWWRDVWHSPMAAEYLKADVHGLYRLAVLVDKFWCHPTEALAGSIAHQQQQYGLSPLDRRRLEWIVERTEQEKQRKPARHQADEAAEDPRQLLRLVQ